MSSSKNPSPMDSAESCGILGCLLSHFDAGVCCEYIFDYLFLIDAVHLDTAMSCKIFRHLYLTVLNVYFNKLLKHDPMIPAACLEWIIDRDIRLERCKIRDLNVEGLISLISSIDNVNSLTALDLSIFYNPLSTRDLGLIARNCPALTELHFSESIHITDRALSTFAKYCSELTLVDFNAPPFQDYSAKSLQSFTQNCTKLHTLCFSFEECVNLKLLKSLQSISNCGCSQYVDNIAFDIADYTEQPEQLIETATLLISSYPNIKFITITSQYVIDLTETLLSAFSQYISILSTAFPELEKIEIMQLPLNNTNTTTNTNTIITSISKFTQLKTLELTICELTDNNIIEISTSLHDLERLNISHNSDLSDLAITTLAQNCHKLEELNMLDLVKVTDISIYALAEHCPKLRILEMCDIQYTDDALRALIHSPCGKVLEELSINSSLLSKEGILQAYHILTSLEHITIVYNIELIVYMIEHAYKLSAIWWDQEGTNYYDDYILIYNPDPAVANALKDNNWKINVYIPHVYEHNIYRKKYAYHRAVC